MHWVTAAGHVRRGDAADHDRGQQGAARRSRACATSARTSARRSSARRSPASTSARTGSASTRRPTTTTTLDAIEDVTDELPRPVPRDPDLPRRAHRGGAHRRQGADRRPHLRRGPERAARRRPRRSRQILAGIDGVEDAARRHLDRRAADRGRGRTWPRRRSTGSSPATSAGPRRPWSPARRSATSSAAGKAYDVVVWSTPQTARTASPTSRTCPSTRRPGKHVRLGDVATVSLQAEPERHRPRGRLAPARRRRERRGPRPRLGRRRAQAEARRRRVRRGYHAELLGEYQERQAAQSPLLATAVVAGAADPAAAAGRRSAAGGSALLVFLTLPMAWSAACSRPGSAGGIVSLGSLVGFFTVFGIAARNGILLINHCQHLEQRRARRSGATWCCAGPGTAVADPDDLAGDRAGPGAAGRPRRTARATRSSTRWRS